MQTTTEHRGTPAPGQTLRNGATVIAADETGPEGLVLAMLVHPGETVDYVTWRYPKGRPEHTYAGDYYYSIAGAVDSFRARGQEG